MMNVKKDTKKKHKREIWKLWDMAMFSGLFSFFVDNEEAQNDDKKFRQLLYQFLFGIVLIAVIFVISFWIYNKNH